MTSPSPQNTDFSTDILGRYTCNGLDEARASADVTRRPDARPFDVIIAGGGSFAGVLAQHLFVQDTARQHRILVLEAGRLALPEHVQNLPVLGLNAPGPVTSDPGTPRAEMWGLPWRTDVPKGFPGLAYCLGGRSVFFGGWSPRAASFRDGRRLASRRRDGPDCTGRVLRPSRRSDRHERDQRLHLWSHARGDARAVAPGRGCRARHRRDPLRAVAATSRRRPPRPGIPVQAGSATRCAGQGATGWFLPLQQVQHGAPPDRNGPARAGGSGRRRREEAAHGRAGMSRDPADHRWCARAPPRAGGRDRPGPDRSG